MICKDCVHYEVCVYCFYRRRDNNVEKLCDRFKPKSRIVELPCDETIIYVKDNWLMLNMESERLGEAIKRSIDYLTKGAKEREKE